jgi:para-nitrobenzyl esterase
VDVFAAIESDRVFTVPAIRLAEAQSKHRDAVHMYTFDWRSPAFDGQFGSPHAIDLSFTFGNFETPAGAAFVGESDAAVEVAGRMMDAWTDFARDGTAAWSELGAWPRYDTERRSTLWIAEQSRFIDDPRADRRRAWDGIQ